MSVSKRAYEESGRLLGDARLSPKDAAKHVTELSKAMVHEPLDVMRAKRYYQDKTFQSAPALDEKAFRRFLSTLALFLKAGSEEEKMRRFKRVAEEVLSSDRLSSKATELANKLNQHRDKMNPNKLKRLGARLSASRDPYEALAHLARFYPLKGVPKEVIDHLVEKLGELDLESFKNLYALGLRFYEARLEGWEG
jgi:hypothetical protein